MLRQILSTVTIITINCQQCKSGSHTRLINLERPWKYRSVRYVGQGFYYPRKGIKNKARAEPLPYIRCVF
jgi:hypothetical protein